MARETMATLRAEIDRLTKKMDEDFEVRERQQRELHGWGTKCDRAESDLRGVQVRLDNREEQLRKIIACIDCGAATIYPGVDVSWCADPKQLDNETAELRLLRKLREMCEA